jgi:poly-gamma-glutamate synthesis protein (capsule biosynthesis protein)
MKLLIAGDFSPTIQHCSKINTNLFKNFEIAKTHDFAILNLEGPLTNINQPIKKMGPNLSINPRWASVIREGGFNIVSLANNHILDMGEAGLLETLDNCQKEGLQCLGAGRNLQEAAKTLIIEKDGVKVGILAFAEKEFSIASENAAGAAPIDSVDNYYAIKALKQKVDHIVLILHAGNENFPYSRPGLVKLCRYYIDLGASAIICHHTHVPTGYEVYKDAPIFYGIGNFYFPKETDEITDWNYGYSVVLNFNADQLLTFDILPHYFDKNGVYPLTGEQKDIFLNEIQRKSNIIQDQILLKQEWGKFVREKQNLYTYNVLSYNRYDRLLFRLKILQPRCFIKKLLLILNYMRCDSHKELLEHALSQILATSDRGKTELN